MGQHRFSDTAGHAAKGTDAYDSMGLITDLFKGAAHRQDRFTGKPGVDKCLAALKEVSHIHTVSVEIARDLKQLVNLLFQACNIARLDHGFYPLPGCGWYGAQIPNKAVQGVQEPFVDRCGPDDHSLGRELFHQALAGEIVFSHVHLSCESHLGRLLYGHLPFKGGEVDHLLLQYGQNFCVAGSWQTIADPVDGPLVNLQGAFLVLCQGKNSRVHIVQTISNDETVHGS